MKTMKREILFRGIPIDENCEWKMITGSLVVDIHGNTSIYHPLNSPLGGFRSVPVKPETVGQFTGITDKNGTKIFEGDIVSYIGSDYTYVISYENGCFIATHTKIKAYDYKPLKWGNVNRFNELSIEIEVIGNINDNPELL